MFTAYYPIISAILANVFAQLVKVPLHLILNKKWEPGLALSTGGMPSSHSSTVAALTTAIALKEGLDSSVFAVSLVFSLIVAYDAMGVRRHAGTHAEAINDIMIDLKNLMTSLFHNPISNETYNKEFKELLGHQPLEVFFGLITGIIVALFLFIYV